MAMARSRSTSLEVTCSCVRYGLAVASYAAQASYIATDTRKRLRAWTGGRGLSRRIAASVSSSHCRATDWFVTGRSPQYGVATPSLN